MCKLLRQQKGKCYLAAMVKRGYVHLYLSERDIITTLHAEGKSFGDNTRTLRRSKGTVLLKTKRYSFPDYRLYLSTRLTAGPNTERSWPMAHG